MGTYSLNSIDESAFSKLCNEPSAQQLSSIAESLSRADVEDPCWSKSPTEWVRQHLAAPDWYEGLTEEEMDAWETAIRRIIDEPEFKLEAHGFHCGVSDMFIEMAAKVYKRRGSDAVVLKFWPYRFFDAYDLDYMGYSPTYALLTNDQVGELMKEVGDYSQLLDEYAEFKPDFVETWREQIGADVKEATPALKEIYDQGRMWYAQFDF